MTRFEPAVALSAHLREALKFAPVRPAIWSGVRAALATVVPLALAQALQKPELAWTGLAGFLTALVDRGGAYWTRARAMGGFLCAAAPLAALGALLGGSEVAAVLASFGIATLLGMSRVWGAAAATVGSCALVITLVSLAQPAPIEMALMRGAWIALGSAWAMTLALALWPVRMYRPARFASARAMRALADYLDELAAVCAAPRALDTDEVARLGRQRGAIRQSLEDARATLAATRRGRRGESDRGELLLGLVEGTDRMFGVTVMLTELVADVAVRAPATAAAARHRLAAFAAALQAIARATERERPDRIIVIAEVLGPDGLDAARDDAHVVATVERLRGLIVRARDMALGLETDRDPDPEASKPDIVVVRRGPLDALRAQLTMRSAVARHALRVGATTAAAALLAHVLELPRGYWVTLAAAATLQPQLPDTFMKVTQRVLGTMAGALIAAALTGVVGDPWVMLVIVFVGAIISVSALPVSYALFATFLTPTFVLLAEARAHDPSLVGVRVIATLIGGGLALAGARLLWPISERDLFPASASAAVATLRRVLWALGGDDRARRELGVALLNAEASLQRWLAEVRRSPAALEAPMALMTYARQLAAASLALGRVSDPPPALQDRVDAVLGDLELAVRDRRAPLPLGIEALEAMVKELADPAVAARATRLVDALEVMHGAAVRWVGKA